MEVFEFELVFALAPDDCDIDAVLERLGAADCTDNNIGIGKSGVMAMEFHREAASLADAVSSATNDVKTIVPGATLTSVSPNIVDLTNAPAHNW